MNAQEYISSGAIEACIMGLANEEDWQELEQMAAVYPEVKEAKERFEQELENQHLSNPVLPPPALREQVLSSMEFTEEKKETTPVVTLPEATVPTKPQVVPLVPTPKPVRWLQRAVAASVLLLMGSILLNFYFYSKSVTYKKEYNALVLQQNSLLAKNKAIEVRFNSLLAKNQANEAIFRMLKNPDVKKITMGSTPAQPGSMATVYWDPHTKDVYLMVNRLPKPAADKQYQLWAIVDGKPVDAGMVGDDEDALLKMHNMPQAEAFAITLEKKGGSPAPTLTAMYVFGKV